MIFNRLILQKKITIAINLNKHVKVQEITTIASPMDRPIMILVLEAYTFKLPWLSSNQLSLSV
jgi:hypothetical protein